MAGYFLRGILIGLLFGIPVGAVGAMTLQRTWSFGFRAGLLTGLGSSVADCLYAIVGAFGLTLISDFLLQHQTIINLLGGGLILIMGIRLIVKKTEAVVTEAEAARGAKMFLSSFAIGITNPAAILTFLFAFSYFGISGTAGLLEGTGLVCGVFIGTYIWWTALSAAACAIRKKTGSRSFRQMNKVFGGILTVFGAVVFLRLLL
ncbi:LysE family translocator [Qiania dongpingensis]|uniref:LysE family transporter n=1 Tax=Qiania dongpingensis TaxID=2763669 RepID=A0A7G9G3D1_9FIRM|nr:LysE family transporter [Qiania dongpingensis]QNM05313.1 LysE family transporter [Qiania dongpingensis]